MPTPDTVPAGNELHWRPIARSDIGDWLALIRRIAAEDKPEWIEQAADLREALSATRDDPAKDTMLGLDSGGDDPEWRRRGTGSALYQWQLDRARRRLAGAAGEVLRTSVEERNASHRALMEITGNAVVRYFTEMTRPLALGIPEIPLPEGLEIRTFSDDLSDAVRRAHNEAFQNHWGSEPRDEVSWRFAIMHPEFRADGIEHSGLGVDTENAYGALGLYERMGYGPTQRSMACGRTV